LLRDLNYAGLLFEPLVVRDLRVLSQPLDASVMYFHTDHYEIDIVLQRPDGIWGAIEVKLGGEELIEQGAASLLAAVSSIDLERTGAPACMAIVTATGRYAYRRNDGVCIVPPASPRALTEPRPPEMEDVDDDRLRAADSPYARSADSAWTCHTVRAVRMVGDVQVDACPVASTFRFQITGGRQHDDRDGAALGEMASQGEPVRPAGSPTSMMARSASARSWSRPTPSSRS
jgi:hypothetical protein